MYTVKLSQVNSSTMMEVPSALLELLDRKNGATVSLVREGDQITITSCRPRYTLEELLAECDPTQPFTDEEREWLDARPVGRELI